MRTLTKSIIINVSLVLLTASTAAIAAGPHRGAAVSGGMPTQAAAQATMSNTQGAAQAQAAMAKTQAAAQAQAAMANPPAAAQSARSHKNGKSRARN